MQRLLGVNKLIFYNMNVGSAVSVSSMLDELFKSPPKPFPSPFPSKSKSSNCKEITMVTAPGSSNESKI